MRNLQRDFGIALILITHDMGVVAEMADRVIIMNAGRLVETGPVDANLRHTRRCVYAVFTRRGTSSRRSRGRRRLPPPCGGGRGEGSTVLSSARVPLGSPRARLARAVLALSGNGGSRSSRSPTWRSALTSTVASFAARSPRARGRRHLLRGMGGETLALVGKSGLRQVDDRTGAPQSRPVEGNITIDGRSTHDLGGAAIETGAPGDPDDLPGPLCFARPAHDRRRAGGRTANRPRPRAAAANSATESFIFFSRVGLWPTRYSRHPHEFSGGQRQRICVARALSLSPRSSSPTRAYRR